MESPPPLRFGNSPALLNEEAKYRAGETFLVRDIYHMFRDYNPLYRTRLALGLSMQIVDELSQARTGKRLRGPLISTYEGLDWLRYSTDRQSLGGFAIQGLMNYARILQDASRTIQPPHDSVVHEAVLTHAHIAWYMAREPLIQENNLGMGPNEKITRRHSEDILEAFRAVYAQEILAGMGHRWENLASECRCPSEEKLREIRVLRDGEAKSWYEFVQEYRTEHEWH